MRCFQIRNRISHFLPREFMDSSDQSTPARLPLTLPFSVFNWFFPENNSTIWHNEYSLEETLWRDGHQAVEKGARKSPTHHVWCKMILLTFLLVFGSLGANDWFSAFEPLRELYVSPAGGGNGSSSNNTLPLSAVLLDYGSPGDLYWLSGGNYSSGIQLI